MSGSAVGYAKRIPFRDDAVGPVRIAIANRLITSSAWGPSTWAPRMRPDNFSTSILKPECVSPTRREEYHEAVLLWWTSNAKPRLCATRSSSPTDASGGTVHTTLGTTV